MNLYEALNWGKGVIERPLSESSTPWMIAGAGADYITLMQGVADAGRMMKADVIATSLATPIINRGLLMLMMMENATGIGGPEGGDRFAAGKEGFRAVSDALDGTNPPESWQGDASAAYARRNTEQQQRAQKMAEIDETVEKVLNAEAEEISGTRTVIGRCQTVLTYQIPPAVALRAIPVKGPALALAFEMAAVAATVPIGARRFAGLAAAAARNATEIRRAGAAYDAVAADARQS